MAASVRIPVIASHVLRMLILTQMVFVRAMTCGVGIAVRIIMDNVTSDALVVLGPEISTEKHVFVMHIGMNMEAVSDSLIGVVKIAVYTLVLVIQNVRMDVSDLWKAIASTALIILLEMKLLIVVSVMNGGQDRIALTIEVNEV